MRKLTRIVSRTVGADLQVGPRTVLIIAAALIAIALWLRLGPLPAGLLALDRSPSTVVLDRHGEVLYESRGDGGVRSIHLSADALPETMIAATLAAEDQRFWSHPGIDPIALGRAAMHDVRRGMIVEGGSTITQQVAKLLLARSQPSQSRGIRAKVQEAIVALRLEHRLTKREILALYLNLAPYGNQLIGAARASQEYFDRRPQDLTAAEAAFLASLPQRPSTFNPLRSPTRARARQRMVLAQMRRSGALDDELFEAASREELVLRREPAAAVAPHFVARVLASVPRPSDGRIQSTLDAGLQRDVQGIIRAQRRNLDRHGAHNVAVVVLDNRTGEWLAWEGSGDYDDKAHSGAIDGVTSPRQPGSALKPFTYALAFESGESPATVLADVPSSFPTAEKGVVYRPENYDGKFRGPLRARLALAGSENVPAVVMASKVGIPDLLRFLRSAGFSTLDKSAAYYGLGLTLGDAEVRLDEVVAAYAAFARGGSKIAPRFTVGAPASAGTQSVVSERTAFWISDILADGDARAYAFGRESALDFTFPVAAKTGTSQAYRDNWAIGYTRDVTVGVWVGNFDREPLIGSSGVTGAAPIFHAVMVAAMERFGTPGQEGDSPTAATAAGSERRLICALSGAEATSDCPSQVEEWLPAERARETCDWHQPQAVGAVAWPAQYHAWAHDRGLLTPARALASSRSTKDGVLITNPPAGATYLIDPTLRADFQTLGLRATSPGAERIEWLVDDRPVGASRVNARFDWPLTPGVHSIVARDQRGGQSEVTITVR